MNMYLISSSSYNLINDEVNKIIQKGNNITNYDLEEDLLSNILEDASYVSLFDETKYILVSNANFFSSDKAKEEDINLLLSYLENGNPNTTLIFTLFKPLDERKKIVKLFKDKYQVIIIKDLTEQQLINKINNLLKKNNKQMSMLSINYLIDMTHRNYDTIINELNKILIYLNDKAEITDEEVKEIVSKYTEIDNFKFSDAIINKNMVKSFSLLEELENNNIDASMLIGLLASQYRIILGISILVSENKSDSEIASTLEIHPYRVKLGKEKSHYYTILELKEHLIFLAELDVKIKKGLLEGYRALEMFILTI